MDRKTFPLIETKADPETGTFQALASVFGNVDSVGDRVLKGAFAKTLEKWRASGDPIPVILSHNWDDPMAMVGKADPRSVYEDERGLVVQGQLDLENPIGKQVHKLMSERLLKGWSFGYTVPKGGQKRKNGANEISEIDLFEVGPTLKGANPEAQLQAVKSGVMAPEEVTFDAEETPDETETKAVTPAGLRALADALESDNPPSDQEVMRRIQGMMGSSSEPEAKASEPEETSPGIEGGEGDAQGPRDPLKDKFDRILLGLE